MSSYRGGRYIYKKWELNNEGNRVASQCYKSQEAALQSNYIKNPDGSEVLRYLRLDVDAEKTLPQWKNEEGAICWFKIARELKEQFPDILRQIEWVTVSDSKLGLHIMIGLSPLPLTDDSLKTQAFCRRIQNNLIEIFNELGIGADTAGKGIKQDFSTFRNKDNVIHHNRILTKKIDHNRLLPPKHRERFLNHLNQACHEALIKLEIKNGYRLYRDLRLEPKIARLFLFLMGLYEPQVEIPIKLFHGSLNCAELTLDDIANIMQTSKRNIYKSFWEKEEIKSLFNVDKTIEGTLRIAVKDTKTIGKRIQRARAVLDHAPISMKYNLDHLFPESIQDGFRNTAIVSWALALKWHGVSKELTLVKIQSLVRQIAGYESSSSCKKSQIKATVASVYRNRREMQGIQFCEALPEWLDVSVQPAPLKKDANIKTTISRSRSIQGVSFAGAELGKKESVSSIYPESSVMVHNSQGIPENPRNFIENGAFEPNNISQIHQEKKIRIVSYKNRVGFFFDDSLILCLIRNRHYKLSKALEYIEKRILRETSQFNVLKNVIHMRHNARNYQKYAQELYKEDTPFIYSQFICGEKKKYLENLEEYDKKKAENLNIPYEEYKKRFAKYNPVNTSSALLDKEFLENIPF